MFSAKRLSSMRMSLRWLPLSFPQQQPRKSPDCSGDLEPGRVLQRSACQTETGGVRKRTAFTLCGLAHYPKFMQETINQAYGAAGRVLTLLSHDTVVASGSVCQVNEGRCMGCGACVSACAYGALDLRDTQQGRRQRSTLFSAKGMAFAMQSVRQGLFH